MGETDVRARRGFLAGFCTGAGTVTFAITVTQWAGVVPGNALASSAAALLMVGAGAWFTHLDKRHVAEQEASADV